MEEEGGGGGGGEEDELSAAARAARDISKQQQQQQQQQQQDDEGGGEDSNNNNNNNEFYTDQALLQRESLRFDPEVRRVLSEIWRVTDENGDGSIQKGEYLEMSRKLYRVVVGQQAGDEAEVRRVAEAEWEHDRFGAEELDRQRFGQSWFQLADLWTDDISATQVCRGTWARVTIDKFRHLALRTFYDRWSSHFSLEPFSTAQHRLEQFRTAGPSF